RSRASYSPLPSSGSCPSLFLRTSGFSQETIIPIAGRSFVRPRDPESWPKHVPTGSRPRFPGCGLAAEIALQRAHIEVAPDIGFDSLRCGDGPRKSGVVRHFMQEGCAPQGAAVGQGGRPLSGVENELNPAICNGIDDVGAPFQHLVDSAGGQTLLAQVALGPGGGDDPETE